MQFATSAPPGEEEQSAYQHVDNWKPDVLSHRLRMLTNLLERHWTTWQREDEPYFSPPINIFAAKKEIADARQSETRRQRRQKNEDHLQDDAIMRCEQSPRIAESTKSSR